MLSPLISELIDALRILPGVGPKSAQRMALHLLERQRPGGLRLTKALESALHRVEHCRDCRMLTEQAVCRLCQDGSRDDGALCVVESPMDVIALEQSGCFRGRYFVLLGRLSPLDGIGPQELGLPQLISRLRDQPSITELIIATNATVEGEATAHYLREATRALPLTVSRIGHGVPMGGELEFVDGNTLTHALSGRRPVP
ncbi:DNA replication and repair protein RecR [Paraperlucidibaca baekdonensis]|uniref:Recombination protein RecR n=1 Tax=Paraperlucidibaca baekdonensis TaxID=748120 RepID=A0A3E0H0V7_9GAMM|nr:recombination mediator RecR [Paraperlucidibaca baekdonensis]REH36693.1 DNA replication and repair protein RecR [Paraperlucidibaca baekdonensis]